MEKNKEVMKSASMISFEDKIVERELSIKPDEALGGLSLVTIEKVSLETVDAPKINPETQVENLWNFAGHTLTNLLIRFKQIPTDKNPKPRYFNLKFRPVPTVGKNGLPIEQKTVINLIKQQYQQLQHIANAMNGLKGFSDVNTAPGIDPQADTETLISQFNEFYKHFASTINGTEETPCYKNASFYLKLVADHSTHTYLTIPSFIGRGFLERVINKANPSIALEPNETIVLKRKENKGKAEQAIGETSSSEIDPEIQAILNNYSN